MSKYEKEEHCEKLYTHCRWFEDDAGDEIGVLFCSFGLIYLGLYFGESDIYEGGEAQIVYKNNLYSLICDSVITKRGWTIIAKKWAIDIWTNRSVK